MGKLSVQPLVYVLGSPLDNYYSIEFWKGIVAGAKTSGLNLVYLIGGIQKVYLTTISKTTPFNEARSTLLYQIFDHGEADGVLLWGAQFLHDAYIGQLETLKTLIDFFRPLPIMSLGWESEGIFSQMPDNYTPVKKLIKHLIEVHGHQKIAYLMTDNPAQSWEATERYRGYCDALKESGIQRDPRLIVTGNDMESEFNKIHTLNIISEYWSDRAVQILIKNRNLIPGKDFTAIAGRDDFSIHRAILKLQELGYNIPGTIAAVGFDDNLLSRCSQPSLTTVRQNFFDQGRSVITELAQIIKQKTHTSSPKDLNDNILIRESCGCVNFHLKSVLSNEKFQDYNYAWSENEKNRYEEILRISQKLIRSPDGCQELQRMIAALGRSLLQSGRDFAEILEMMRRQSRQIKDSGKSNIEMEALIALTSDNFRRLLIFQNIENDTRRRQIESLTHQMFVNYDLKSVLDGLDAQLPFFSVFGCALILYQNGRVPEAGSKLVFWSWNGQRKDIDPDDGIVFKTSEMLPEGFSPFTTNTHCLNVEPILFSAERLGYLVLEVDSEKSISTNELITALSNSLKGSMLIQNLAEANIRIEELARMDSLTGLLNRRSFEDIITDECLRADRYIRDNRSMPTLLFIDLDNFKYYNDTFGHAIGDDVLREFAKILLVSARVTDKVIRYGGDEFVILLPETVLDGAVNLAERIIEKLKEENGFLRLLTEYTKLGFTIPDEKKLSSSIGIAVHHRTHCPSEIIKNADQALYQAKAAGKCRYSIWEAK